LEATRLVATLPILQKLSLEKQQFGREYCILNILNKDNVAQHVSKKYLEERILLLEEEHREIYKRWLEKLKH
jgi:hypothetical protein